MKKKSFPECNTKRQNFPSTLKGSCVYVKLRETWNLSVNKSTKHLFTILNLFKPFEIEFTKRTHRWKRVEVVAQNGVFWMLSNIYFHHTLKAVLCIDTCTLHIHIHRQAIGLIHSSIPFSIYKISVLGCWRMFTLSHGIRIDTISIQSYTGCHSCNGMHPSFLFFCLSHSVCCSSLNIVFYHIAEILFRCCWLLCTTFPLICFSFSIHYYAA